MTSDLGTQLEARLLPLYSVAFNAMKGIGPDRLLRRVRSEAQLDGVEELASEDVLLEALAGEVGANPLAARIRTELALWDAATAQPWADGTEPKTDERRALVYDRLELSNSLCERL